MVKITVKTTQVEYVQLNLVDGEVVTENNLKIVEWHKTVEQAQKILAKEKIGVMVREVKPLVEKYEIEYINLRKYGVEK